MVRFHVHGWQGKGLLGLQGKQHDSLEQRQGLVSVVYSKAYIWVGLKIGEPQNGWSSTKGGDPNTEP